MNIINNENEIIELKGKLKIANQIIEKQAIEIEELRSIISSFENIDDDVNDFKKEIIQKNDKINKLTQQLENINLNNNEFKQINVLDMKSVSFITADQKLFYSIPCSGNSTFAEVEEKLYKEYPEYRETNNTFFANGAEILRFKTINDNKIGSGRPVILVKPA